MRARATHVESLPSQHERTLVISRSAGSLTGPQALRQIGKETAKAARGVLVAGQGPLTAVPGGHALLTARQASAWCRIVGFPVCLQWSAT